MAKVKQTKPKKNGIQKQDSQLGGTAEAIWHPVCV
jgi:hypothetical protein